MTKKILFITHDLSRTGAPIVVLRFANWIRQNYSSYKIHLLALKDGPLKGEVATGFEKVFVLSKESSLHYFLPKLFNLLMKKPVSELNFRIPFIFKNRLFKENYDLVYANTVLSIPVACEIRRKTAANTKIIAHIHELSSIITLCLPEFRKYSSQIEKFVAASNLVRQDLISNWKVDPRKIEMIYDFSDLNTIPKNHNKPKNETFTIGGSGTVHWRKGYDIFIQVAAKVIKIMPQTPVRFIWVGAIDQYHKIITDSDLKKLNIYKKVEFIGEVDNPLKIFDQFDIFLCTSREDPFPLVCIEAGALGVPIICFEEATGTAEVLRNGGGKALPYLDVSAMAKTIVRYIENPDLLKIDSNIAKNLFSSFTVENQCTLLSKIVLKIVN